MFDRLELLLHENLDKIAKVNVLLIGLGGVGGYTLEVLVRSGFINITVIDKDNFELTNINRQILANSSNLNKEKVIEAKNRALLINPNCKIKALKIALNEDNINEVVGGYDYVIDACDDTKTKIALIKYAKDNKIKLISCMGTANRLNPLELTTTSLEKTSNDPLAKKIRTSLPKKYLNTKVVWSREVPIKNKGLGTICYVPMMAGALLAKYVIEDIIKNN